MITWKDIFLRALLAIGACIILSVIFGISFVQSNVLIWFLIIITIGAFYTITRKKVKDKSRISDLIKPDLAALNYTILSERPLTIKEEYENYELDFGPFVNGLSINRFRYKNQMKRLFVVRNEKGHDFELIITIIQTWRNKIRYRIESTSRIRN